MVSLYNSETRTETWIQATKSLLNDADLNTHKYERTEIILEIDSPTKVHPLDKEIFRNLDEIYRSEEKEPTHTIAEWIFPGWIYKKEGIQGVYETYPEQMEVIVDSNPGRWGTYAYRLVRRADPNSGDVYNPLKTMIEKLKSNIESDHATYKSIYELEMLQGPYNIPLFDSSEERKKYRNLPCLAHLSVKITNGKIDLTAFYRAHDYRYKVPGNLLGLARLQDCISNEVGAQPGKMVIHSSRAFVDNSGGIPKFRQFVNSTSNRL